MDRAGPDPRDAAAALAQGDPSAAMALLRSWRFAEQPPWCEALVRGHLLPHAAQTDWVSGALERLAGLGDEIQTRLRLPWERAVYLKDPPKDALVARMWRGWQDGDPWAWREQWEDLFLAPAWRAFSTVLQLRGLPVERRRAVAEDVAEGFFFLLLGGREGVAGWRELAVRTLETRDGGPVAALASALDAAGWLAVGRCAVRRGHGRQTAALLWPDVAAQAARARGLARLGLADPGVLERLTDLHVATRLIARWHRQPDPRPAGAWRVILQNRGRVRARLRAVLRGASAPTLIGPLLDTPGLYARTRAAVTRLARDWAWQQLHHGFSFAEGRPVDADCRGLALGPRRPTPRQDLLRAWVMLVILKGRLPHLLRWVWQGGTGDRDATWGRLLTTELPEALRAADDRKQGLHALRADLLEGLPGLLESLAPTVAALARLDPGRPDLAEAFRAALRPVWSEVLPLPRVRYPTYLRRAAAAAVMMKTWRPPT